MQDLAGQQSGKFLGADEFRYLVWRANRNTDAWKEMTPEVLSTNGSLVRRMWSERNYIAYQTFQHTQTSQNIISGVEASVEPGVSLIGYSSFRRSDQVAILYTGSNLRPGWAASAKRSDSFQVGLPSNIEQVPKLRIVAGAALYWSNRELVIHAALEQRGSRFAASPYNFHILDHLVSWEVRTIVNRDGQQRELHVAKTPEPVSAPSKINDKRIEASFAIEPMVYKQFRNQNHQVWFVLKFDRELFCLPEEWSTFWFQVDVHEPPGMLF